MPKFPYLWQIGHRKWFLNTTLFLIKPFLIAKFECTIAGHQDSDQSTYFLFQLINLDHRAHLSTEAWRLVRQQ